MFALDQSRPNRRPASHSVITAQRARDLWHRSAMCDAELSSFTIEPANRSVRRDPHTRAALCCDRMPDRLQCPSANRR